MKTSHKIIDQLYHHQAYRHLCVTCTPPAKHIPPKQSDNKRFRFLKFFTEL